MKMAMPVSNPASAVDEAQRILALQMRNPPKWGTVGIKAVFCGGTCRRLEVKRKTATQLEAGQPD
jgi:hypothetical protein